MLEAYLGLAHIVDQSCCCRIKRVSMASSGHPRPVQFAFGAPLQRGGPASADLRQMLVALVMDTNSGLYRGSITKRVDRPSTLRMLGEAALGKAAALTASAAVNEDPAELIKVNQLVPFLSELVIFNMPVLCCPGRCC